mgnify:FL=1
MPDEHALTLADNERAGAWEQAAQEWLGNFDSERTRETYRAAWLSFRAHCAAAPWDVTRLDVIGWRDAMSAAGLAGASISLRLSALSSFYRYAQEQGLAQDNPADGIKRPKVRAYAGAKVLTLEEAERVLATIPDTLRGRRDRALLGLALTMGLRRAELLGIRRRDILEGRGGGARLRYTPKGGEQQERPLPSAAWRVLRRYLDDMGDVGPDTRLFALTPDGLRYIVAAYTRRALGEAVNVHALRHTAASVLYGKTGKGKDVQELLGHSRPSVTDRYIHALLEDDRRGELGDVIGDALGL